MLRLRKKSMLGGLALVALVAGLFASVGSGGAASSPNISVKSFTKTFSAMKLLRPITAKGKGSIVVILPDTVTSTRYTEFDAPYLTKAFKTAGMSSSQFKVQNALGSTSTQLTDAQAAISQGATVLVVDPLTSVVGAQIEKLAKQHGVKTIDYDRLTLGGSRTYYVSFDNVRVGKLLGKGLVSCVSAWKANNPALSHPNVIVMRGDPTDNNATLFFQGYNSILSPLFKAGWTDVANPAGTWTPSVALTEFQQAFQANSKANAGLMPNDENAAPIITFLQSKNVKPQTFPLTGQDATLIGLQNIISGYQCGTVYKPIYLEAEATAALALYARANMTPPAALVNGTVQDTQNHVGVKSVLEIPEWVTPAKMQSTIVADGFVPASQICSSKYKTFCTKYGIH